MNFPLARTVRKLKEAISRRLPQRRDDSGLTTLEWLLIVAAVAGLAALAVVLVQNVVSDTSEQIAGSSARKTAAQIAASTLVEDAKAATVTDFLPTGSTTVTDAQAYVAWANYYREKCDRIKIIYSDAGVEIVSGFKGPLTATTAFTALILATATTTAAAAAVPQASCVAT